MSSEHASRLPTRLEPGFITTPDGRYPVVLGDVSLLSKNKNIVVITYATLAEYGCDFAAIFMPPGESTPFQVVKHGKTVEFPAEGDFVAIVQHTSGTIEVHAFYEADPQTHHARVTYEEGDVICCIAVGKEQTVSIEQTTPPFENSMFEDIDENNPAVGQDFLEIREIVLTQAKTGNLPGSTYTVSQE